MSFPRYPKYKPSGAEWLGDVPEHWELRRLTNVASHNDEVLTEAADPDGLIEYVDISSVESGRGIVSTESIRFRDAPSRARRRVKHGDVIVSTVRTYLRAIARIAHPSPNMIVSTGFAVVRPRSGLSTEFLGYLLEGAHFVEAVIARSTGVSYPSINASDLVRIGVCFPPISEQRAIAAFLDRETAKIDALIAEQEKLIELLAEKRQAVISHAVTKGLDPAAPMKPSGVEWLGEVPEHWELRRLTHVASHNDEVLTEDADPDGLIEYVDISSVEGGRGIVSTETLRFRDAPSRARRRIKHGDVIVSTVRTYLRAIARVVDPSPNMIVSTGFAVVRPRPGLCTDFLGYVLQGTHFVEAVIARSTGVSYPSINASELARISLCFPPFAEQQSIAACLDRETAKIDGLVAEAEKAVELLRERRSALISAAVTGQIDVRNASPELVA